MVVVGLMFSLLLGITFSRGAITAFKNRTIGPLRWLGLLGGVLGLLGVLGFFGALSLGPVLPSWVEWPVGFTNGVVTLGNGVRVVPHQTAMRVQVYDRNWRFLRAWPIESRGGSFDATPVEATDDEFVVRTARGSGVYRFRVDSSIVNGSTTAIPTGQVRGGFFVGGKYTWVPTYWILLPLSGPVIAWLSIVSGVACLVGSGGFSRR